MIIDIFEKLKIYGLKKFTLYFFVEMKMVFINQLILNSYSQKGEDMEIDKLLKYKKNGFYIDVGAHDPYRLSNTFRFYKKGWTGINIEPDINNYKKFLTFRKNDINLNMGIVDINGEMDFYKFIPETLSTFSKEEADKYVKQGYKLVEVKKVKIYKLDLVLDEYCKNKEIDFMSIDTEGFDMQVLKSNNWTKFKPKIICIESVIHNINKINNEKTDNHDKFLIELGYKKAFDNKLNSIYVL